MKRRRAGTSESAYDLYARGCSMLAGGHPHQAVMLLSQGEAAGAGEGVDPRGARPRALRVRPSVSRSARVREGGAAQPIRRLRPFRARARMRTHRPALASPRARQAGGRPSAGRARLRQGARAAVGLTACWRTRTTRSCSTWTAFCTGGPSRSTVRPTRSAPCATTGKRIAFVTNNASRTPAQVAERLASVGVDAEPEEVVTSALATAAVLAERGIRLRVRGR